MRERERVAMLLGSPSAHVTYCRVHQRAWVESLDRWLAFRTPTRDGVSVTDAPCDTCTALPIGAEGSGGRRGWSEARGGRAEAGRSAHEEGGVGEERRHAAAHMTRAHGEPWHTGRVEVVAAP
jgi:hypothetical protein